MAKLIKNDINKEGWEEAQFPIACETCLGENPYIRMTKAQFDKECKVCARPFTVFRWKPGPRSRYKKTEVCQTCSKLKNVCQVCLLDLKYGLPVQVRDAAKGGKSMIPVSDVNREYYADQAERALEASGKFGSEEQEQDLKLARLARRAPYYKRNEAHICSFFLRGECNRGATCPYRHINPEDEYDPALAKQNFKDRYYGTNDPVAEKMLRRQKKTGEMVPPSDKLIKTLWIGNVRAPVDETDIRDHLYSYGEISNVNVVKASNCAFVTFTERSSAEAAAKALWNGFDVRGVNLSLDWGKSQPTVPALSSAPTPALAGGAWGYQPVPPPGAAPSVVSGGPAPYYPSMDPSQFGSRVIAASTAAAAPSPSDPVSTVPPNQTFSSFQFRSPMINPAP